MNKFTAYIRLTRPLNLLIAMVSIFIGGFITGTIEPLINLIAACLSGLLIMAGANAVNDYFDYEIDKINKPNRPLAADIVSRKGCHVFSLLLFLAGMVLAAFINLGTFIIAVLTSLTLYVYSSHLKRTMIWGNVAVGFISGLAFVYGGMAVGRGGLAILVGIFAFFFHWGREIIKDIEDMSGDRALGLKTLPLVKGKAAALDFTTVVLVLLIAITLIPFFTNWFSWPYFAVVIPGVDLFLIYVLISIRQNSGPENLHRIAVAMKFDMLAGLLAVFIGR